jgi:hypothetical protein
MAVFEIAISLPRCFCCRYAAAEATRQQKLNSKNRIRSERTASSN